MLRILIISFNATEAFVVPKSSRRWFRSKMNQRERDGSIAGLVSPCLWRQSLTPRVVKHGQKNRKAIEPLPASEIYEGFIIGLAMSTGPPIKANGESYDGRDYLFSADKTTSLSKALAVRGCEETAAVGSIISSTLAVCGSCVCI